MKTIKELAAELDARKAEAVRAQAALDKARKAVESVGEEPPAGSLIRFEVRLSSGLYSYAALHVRDRGWYATGNLSYEAQLSMGGSGPLTWERLCSKVEPGSLRVATGYSTSTLDAKPIKSTMSGPRVGPSLREQREGTFAHSVLFGMDLAGVAKSMRKTGINRTGMLFEQRPDGTVRQVKEIPLVSPTVLDAGSAQAFADNQANRDGARYYVRPRREVRASQTSPGEESVMVREVVQRGSGDVVASFEGPDAQWQAAQSAAQRNHNAAKG